jgi:hypothetical protein
MVTRNTPRKRERIQRIQRKTSDSGRKNKKWPGSEDDGKKNGQVKHTKIYICKINTTSHLHNKRRERNWVPGKFDEDNDRVPLMMFGAGMFGKD